MRIVITGASGNVGTAVLRRLASDTTSHEVVGVVRRAPPAEPPYDAVSWRALDLAEPDAQFRLADAMAGADAVVHLAWLFQPSRDPDYLERTGVGGTRAVVAAAQVAGVRHLVHMSSLGAYSPGPDGVRVDESWPTEGIDTLYYSRHKVAAERILDEVVAAQAGQRSRRLRIARLRPGLVVQRDAGSALLRYGVPPYVPSRLLRHLPVLPLDRRFVAPLVHTDDVADAVVRVLHARAEGAFNLAAEPPITRDDLAAALGARGLHLPAPLLRTVADVAWRARLQPVDPGWLDLALAVPLLDSTRARTELGWEPAVDARAALAQLVDGMAEGVGTASPALRPRSVLEQVGRLVRHGPIGDRRLP